MSWGNKFKPRRTCFEKVRDFAPPQKEERRLPPSRSFVTSPAKKHTRQDSNQREGKVCLRPKILSEWQVTNLEKAWNSWSKRDSHTKKSHKITPLLTTIRPSSYEISTRCLKAPLSVKTQAWQVQFVNKSPAKEKYPGLSTWISGEYNMFTLQLDLNANSYEKKNQQTTSLYVLFRPAEK